MTNIVNVPIAAAAYEAFLPAAREASQAQVPYSAGTLPSLYLSHGAPPLLNDAQWMRELSDWALSIPKPRGILVVSAHWESAPLAISSPTAGTPLVYDFGGFDQRFYRLQYPTPDASALAAALTSLMPASEPLHRHTQRGLDHGAWIPLMVMYPLGDVPVLQLSMPTHDPARLMALGARLKPLREQGILIVGSGFMTHGLPFLQAENYFANRVPSWSSEFDAWAAQALADGDLDALADFRANAPGMPYAHPTVEHFTPLFITLGAADDPAAPPITAIDGYAMGLAKRSVQAT